MDVTRIIGETLKDLIPDIKQIRRNNLEQGNLQHAFYIRQGRSSAQNQLFNYQQRRYPYILHYFPEEYPDEEIDQRETRCWEMNEQLMTQFLYLKDHFGKVLNAQGEVHEGVLLFSFDIRLRVKLPEPLQIKMQSIEERSDINV